MTTKKSKKLVVSLSKAVLGLSLVTYLHAGDIQDDLTNYIKKYEPELYEKVKDGEIEIDDSVSPQQEDVKDEIVPPPPPINPRRECNRYRGIFLENKYVATCVSRNGTFGNGYHSLGMTYNPNGTGTVNSPDFLRPGTPWEFFSVKFNGHQYVNNNTGTQQIPTRISTLNRYSSNISYHEGGVMVRSWVGNWRTGILYMTQKYTVDPNSREIIVRVEMYNPSRVTLRNLYYARGLNPNQDGRNNIYYPYHTLNIKGGHFGGLSINSNNIAQGIGINSNLAVALYSVDPIRHNTCISRRWTTNPQAIALNSSPLCDNPSVSYSDSTINIGFYVGNLYPKQKRVFSFKYLFEKRSWIRIKPIGIKTELK